MNLGYAMHDLALGYDDPAVRALQINISGCPNSCGQHWTAEIGFYGNARKIDVGGVKKEVPYYQLLLGGGYDEQGVMRFGLQMQSMPRSWRLLRCERDSGALPGKPARGRDVPELRAALQDRVLPRLPGRSGEAFERDPDVYKDWGDTDDFSLQLGRGECAA